MKGTVNDEVNDEVIEGIAEMISWNNTKKGKKFNKTMQDKAKKDENEYESRR